MTNPTPAQWWDYEIRGCDEQLRYLTMAAYAYAALSVLGVCWFLLVFGIGFISFSQIPPSDNVPRFPMFLFGGMAAVAVLMSLTFTVLNFVFARFLQTRKNHTACLVLSGVSCMSVPFGTAVGVWGLIVLNRPGAKVLFQKEIGSTDTPPFLASPYPQPSTPPNDATRKMPEGSEASQ